MEDFMKCYPIQDNTDDEIIYGCLIMSKNYDFDTVKFQDRINKAKEDLIPKDITYFTEEAEDVIFEVLSKYSEEYKGVSYIRVDRNFYI